MMMATRLDSVLAAVKSAPKPAAAAPAKAAEVVSESASAALFAGIKSKLDAASQAEKDAYKGKVKAIFQFDIKSKDGKVQTFVLDLKENVGVHGAGPKADVTIAVSDGDFMDMSAGTLTLIKANSMAKKRSCLAKSRSRDR
jgi:putative sterol carrier protein